MNKFKFLLQDFLEALEEKMADVYDIHDGSGTEFINAEQVNEDNESLVEIELTYSDANGEMGIEEYSIPKSVILDGTLTVEQKLHLIQEG